MSSDRHSIKFVGNTNVDGATVYIIKVTNPDGDTWNIQKRYHEIRNLHDQLRERHGDNLPLVPPKRFFSNLDPVFIRQRQAQLQMYLEGVLQLERELRTPALKEFLGGPTTHGERNQQQKYQQIVDNMQSKLLKLMDAPAPLDDSETEARVKKYQSAMKLNVLNKPVDPSHLRAPGFNGEPIQLSPSNAEELEALKAPPNANDGKLLSDMLDQLHRVLHPKEPLTDPDRLVAQFPPVSTTANAG